MQPLRELWGAPVPTRFESHGVAKALRKLWESGRRNFAEHGVAKECSPLRELREPAMNFCQQ
jgi:hypothetical protein